MAELRMRRLGRTALLVSELGFGASNVAVAPEGEKALLRAFALGINFVETGRVYRGSEYMIGGALSRLRDRVVCGVSENHILCKQFLTDSSGLVLAPRQRYVGPRQEASDDKTEVAGGHPVTDPQVQSLSV